MNAADEVVAGLADDDNEATVWWQLATPLSRSGDADGLYSVRVKAVDKAGNQGSFPGQTFTVPAFYLRMDDKTLIGLDCKAVYMTDGLNLRPEARQYAQEVMSLVRFFRQSW